LSNQYSQSEHPPYSNNRHISDKNQEEWSSPLPSKASRTLYSQTQKNAPDTHANAGVPANNRWLIFVTSMISGFPAEKSKWLNPRRMRANAASRRMLTRMRRMPPFSLRPLYSCPSPGKTNAERIAALTFFFNSVPFAEIFRTVN
jgi:hypothetical protein